VGHESVFFRDEVNSFAQLRPICRLFTLAIHP
jgi:hypothetical protein